MYLHTILEETKELARTFVQPDVFVDTVGILEVEISRFSSIIVEGEEYLFLHNLEKTLQLLIDEYLSMICIEGKFPYDQTSNPIDHMLLPLGDNVMETVAPNK